MAHLICRSWIYSWKCELCSGEELVEGKKTFFAGKIAIFSIWFILEPEKSVGKENERRTNDMRQERENQLSQTDRPGSASLKC